MDVDPLKFSSLQQWLDWQQQLHPDEIELGLDRINKVWQTLGAPPLAETVITVAGTNGKGSSIAYLEAIYSAAGYRVGSFTSPHLFSYPERIRINCEMVSESRICEAFRRIEKSRQENSLTYFEFGALAAFEIFSDDCLDIVLLEVGLGGRLDAVNIIDADCVLLTSIGIDHVAWLGDTRELIGAEKAGVMREGQLVVCADTSPPESVLAKALQLKIELCLAGRDYKIQCNKTAWSWLPQQSYIVHNVNPQHSLPYPVMRGLVQRDNAASAIAMVMSLYQKHPVAIAAIRTGIQSARVAGRFEVLPGPVNWIFDVAHNNDSTQVLAENLRQMGCSGTTRALFSVLQDKELPTIMKLIGGDIDEWLVCPLESSRGRSFAQIGKDIEALKLHDKDEIFTKITLFGDVKAAVQALKSESASGDRVVVFGSFILVAEAMSLV